MTGRALVLLFVMSLCATALKAQRLIGGRVSTTHGDSLAYFNIIVENPTDSSYISASTHTSANFRCEIPSTDDVLLHFSSLGYEDKYVLVNAKAIVTPIAVVMQPMVIGGVEVTAKMITTKGSKMTVLVGGTQLQKLDNVVEILKRVPTLRADDEALQFFGKGTPLVYIDNRKATYDELKQLQPTEITSIEADRNSSAKYDAQYSSVLRVKTNRTTSGFSAQISEQASIYRHFNNLAGVQMQANSNGWYNYISFYSGLTHRQNFPESQISMTTKERLLRDTISSDEQFRSPNYSLTYGSRLKTGSKGELTWQYILWHDSRPRHKNNTYFDTEHIEEGAEPIKVVYTKNSRTESNTRHRASMGYQYMIDTTSTLKIDADMVLGASSSANDIHHLTNGESSTQYISGDDNSSAIELLMTYNKKIGAMTLDAGAQYDFLSGKTHSDYDAKLTSTTFLNHNIAAYCTFGADYEKWGYELGLRNEATYDQTKENSQTLRAKWDNYIFPSAKIFTNSLWKSLSLALVYSSGIRRPSFYELSPKTIYSSSVEVLRGNPLLKPSVSHNLSLSATIFENLILTAEYRYSKDPVLNTGMLSDDGNNIIFTYVNIDKSHRATFMTTYSNKWGIFTLNADASVDYNHAKIPVMGAMTINDGASFSSSLSTALAITKTTLLACNFSYNSRSRELMTNFNSTNNLSVSCTQSLFKERIMLTVGVYDIFRKSNPGWEDRFEDYLSLYLPNRDSRFARLTIRYNFKKFRAKYQIRQNSDVLDRL